MQFATAASPLLRLRLHLVRTIAAVVILRGAKLDARLFAGLQFAAMRRVQQRPCSNAEQGRGGERGADV